MNSLTLQTKQISELLPKIARNLQIARLIDEVKPGLTTSQLMILLILRDKEDTMLPVGKLAQQLSISFPAVVNLTSTRRRSLLLRFLSTSFSLYNLSIIPLTAGKEIVEKLLKAFEDLLFDVLKKIPKTERKAITKAVKRVFEFSIALSEDAHDRDVSLAETAA